ncbi:hypothetical protein [Sphingobacterium bambusae]|uniref:Uncharacterized protein n=1 Tax=Sphingobacterium bambusae TaxID=662858 RepID=A0ABW6BLQ9_9SPHI|nr:hypothetical protein [Sphingobacterium bambusae]WPL48172.1 hypothetical protein SCB77_19650 [Sphingobacterium bambusae]
MEKLPLHKHSIWEQLDSPFRNAAEVPAVLEELSITFDPDLLVEITTEYITHQMSLYQVTFAAFPHLLATCESAEDRDFRLQALLDITVMFAEYGGDAEMEAIFLNSQCKLDRVNEIKTAFKEAFKRLKAIVHSAENDILQKDESERKYFLLALAVAYEIYPVAAILWRYHDNEEYECSCPHCDETFTLWNEADKLVIYKEDPVFTKTQQAYAIQPAALLPSCFSKTITADKNYEWLSYYIHMLNITSLQKSIDYLFGKANCPYCETEFDVFENIQ